MISGTMLRNRSIKVSPKRTNIRGFSKKNGTFNKDTYLNYLSKGIHRRGRWLNNEWLVSIWINQHMYNFFLFSFYSYFCLNYWVLLLLVDYWFNEYNCNDHVYIIDRNYYMISKIRMAWDSFFEDTDFRGV